MPSRPTHSLLLRLAVLAGAGCLVLAPPRSAAASGPDAAADAPAPDGQVAAGGAGPEMSLDEVYERAFGHKRSLSAQHTLLPLVVNDRARGEVMARAVPGDGGSLELEQHALLTALDPVLQDAALSQLSEVGRDWLSLADLRTVGLSVRFDEAAMRVHVDVPAHLLAPGNDPSGGLPSNALDALGSSSVSGFLNVRGGRTFTWAPDKDGDRSTLDLETALQVKGWVLENRATWEHADTSKVQRHYTRLVRDDTSRGIRYVAGDFATPYTGLQDGAALFGASAARNFSLQPYEPYRPTHQFAFVLEEAATVHVYLNGQLVRTLQLDAGPHDLRDLPLSLGANQVRLVIVGPSGRERELTFATALSMELLKKGLHEFAYGIGFPLDPTRVVRTYDWSAPTLSAIHRTGISRTQTLQAHLMAMPSMQVAGVGHVAATRLGNVSVDLALSHRPGEALQPAARLRYDLFRGHGSTALSQAFYVGLEYRPAGFGSPGVFRATPPSSVQAGYSHLLPAGLLASAGIQHRIAGLSSWDEQAISYQLGLQKTLFRRVNASVQTQLSKPIQADPTWGVQLSFTAFLPGLRQSINGSARFHGDRSPTQELIVNQSVLGRGQQLQGTATLTNGKDTRSVAANVQVTGPRGVLGTSHQFDALRPGSHVTHVSAGAALAFADGVFALSRPIHGSFALVGTRARLAGKTVRINSTSRGFASKVDWLGPAVLSNLQPHFVTDLRLDAPELDIGEELGPSSYAIRPGYRSGSLLRVGTEASVVAQGVLREEDGTPVAFGAGVIDSVSDPAWPSAMMFTNRTGRFFAEGLKPGLYQIRLFGDGERWLSLRIPETEGLVDLGEITVSGRPIQLVEVTTAPALDAEPPRSGPAQGRLTVRVRLQGRAMTTASRLFTEVRSSYRAATDVPVSLSCGADRRDGRTDDAGELHFEGLHSCAWRLHVGINGLPSGYELAERIEPIRLDGRGDRQATVNFKPTLPPEPRLTITPPWRPASVREPADINWAPVEFLVEPVGSSDEAVPAPVDEPAPDAPTADVDPPPEALGECFDIGCFVVLPDDWTGPRPHSEHRVVLESELQALLHDPQYLEDNWTSPVD